MNLKAEKEDPEVNINDSMCCALCGDDREANGFLKKMRTLTKQEGYKYLQNGYCWDNFHSEVVKNEAACPEIKDLMARYSSIFDDKDKPANRMRFKPQPITLRP